MTITQTPEKDKEEPIKIFKKAQEAIDAVQKDHAVAVWSDTYMDQSHPNYIVFYDVYHHSQFLGALDKAKNPPDDPNEREKIFAEVDRLAGTEVEPRWNLKWLYKDGKWAYSPEEILEEEDAQLSQDEDDEWFDAQRRSFEERENPPPSQQDEPWRKELMEKALEIAAGDGRPGNPEEADFNTAVLILGDKIPKKIRDDLDKYLEAVEEGRSYSSE